MTLPDLSSVTHLIRQGRHKMALDELNQVLAGNPDYADAHCLYAVCQTVLKNYEAAMESAGRALALAPDRAYPYYTAAIVNDERNDLPEAERYVRKAIEIDPSDEDNFSLLASILLQQKQWSEALSAAETGLRINPEDIDCHNVYAMAMTKLGRKSDAQNAIESALRRDPDRAISHANLGWSHLENRNQEEAFKSFREALRLDPEMEWARQGILEAMKSQFFLYRWLLQFFLWMGKLEGRSVWGIILAGYIGTRVASGIIANYPVTSYVLMPLIVLYFAFCALTWVGGPVFNMILRFHPFGKLVLSDQERKTSTMVAIILGVAMSLLAMFLFISEPMMLVLAAGIGLMIVPVSSYENVPEGWPQVFAKLNIGVMSYFAILGLGALVFYFLSSTDNQIKTAGVLIFVSGVGLIALGIAGMFGMNFLARTNPRRDASTSWAWWTGGIISAALVGIFTMFYGSVLAFGA